MMPSMRHLFTFMSVVLTASYSEASNGIIVSSCNAVCEANDSQGTLQPRTMMQRSGETTQNTSPDDKRPIYAHCIEATTQLRGNPTCSSCIGSAWPALRNAVRSTPNASTKPSDAAWQRFLHSEKTALLEAEAFIDRVSERSCWQNCWRTGRHWCGWVHLQQRAEETDHHLSSHSE